MVSGQQQKIRKPRIVGFIIVMYLATLLLFLPKHLGTPIRALEAKTFDISSHYFTTTFLSAMFDNTDPLYYLFAHFISPFSNSLGLLRTASLAFTSVLLAFVISEFFSYPAKLPSKRKLNMNLMIFSIFFGVVPCAVGTLLYSSFRATPDALACTLGLLSATLFVRVAVFKETRFKPLFFLTAALAMWTDYVALSIPVLALPLVANQHFRAKGQTGRKNRPGFTLGDNLKLAGLALPAIGFALLAGMKQQRNLMDINQLSIPLLYSLAAFMLSLFVFHPDETNSLIVRAFRFLFAFLIAATSVVMLGHVLDDAGAADISDNFDSVFMRDEVRKTDDSTGLVFLNFNEADSSADYLFNYHLKANHKSGVVYPPLNRFETSSFRQVRNLGFDTVKQDSPLTAMKALVLQSDSVKIILYRPDKKQLSAKGPDLAWVSKAAGSSFKPAKFRTVTDSTQKLSNIVIELPTDDIRKDGILLDLLLNDYGEFDKAAALISDESFNPISLQSYFWDTRPGQVAEHMKRLFEACGDETSCKRITGSKACQWTRSVRSKSSLQAGTVLKRHFPDYCEPHEPAQSDEMKVK